MQPNTATTTDRTADRTVGIWLAAASILLIVALVMHPPPPADAATFMEVVAAHGNAWFAVHWLAAVALSAFVISGLIALARSTLARDTLTTSAWGVLTVGALWTVIAALAEATVLADVAAAGDLATFERWQAFAEGAAMGFAVLGLAVAVIATQEARVAAARLPRWSALVAVPAGIASFAGFTLTTVFGVPFGGPVWLASSLLMNAWLAWYGIALTRAAGARPAPAEVTTHA